METPDSERPVSYSSTSSSASSRDSHCSSLAPTFRASPETDPQAGAIRLELVPAGQLECGDPQLERSREAMHGHAQATVTPATSEPMAEPAAEPAAEPTGPKLQYVDRVVQEILDTERTYVQDLRSIVQVRVQLGLSLNYDSFIQNDKHSRKQGHPTPAAIWS